MDTSSWHRNRGNYYMQDKILNAADISAFFSYYNANKDSDGLDSADISIFFSNYNKYKTIPEADELAAGPPTSTSTSPGALPPTSERAEEMLKDVDSTRLRIANIKRENGNYDIFFKGKEVLEYKANLNGEGTLDNSQIDPIFKNLFNNDQYNSHIITDNQLYHARKEGDWNENIVHKIFENCNFKIESIDDIRYEDTTVSNQTRVEKLGNDYVDVVV